MELRQYIAVIRKYLWLIVLTTMIGGSVAYYTSVTTPPLYRAMTTLEINRAQSEPLNDPFASANAQTAENAANVLAAKIQSSVFLEDVKDRLNLDIQIKDMLSVAQVGSTQFLRISAESNDPALSQALADTTAQVFIAREREQQRARYQESLEGIDARIENLETSIAATRIDIATLGEPDEDTSQLERLERARLESLLSQDQTRLVVLLNSAEEFRLAMTRYTDYISVYAPAEVEIVGTSTLQNTLLGAVTGLMVGLGIAFLLEYLDDTIRSPEDVKRGLNLTLLGALPRVQDGDGLPGVVVVDYPLQPVSEAFRNLRASIRFATLDEPAQTLLVTSPLPTEGKSFTAVNLAATLAQGGATVVLVDLDLRHPTVHRFLDIDQEPGLTDALLLDAEHRDQVIKTIENIPGLRVITAGQHTRNPADLLTSQTFRAFLDGLKADSDIVIIDSPPVLPVADAVMLAGLVDRVILVLENGTTRRLAASQAVERLTSTGGWLLGAVLNQIDQRSNGYYGYYYYYYPQQSESGRSRGLSRRFPFVQSQRRKRHSRRKETHDA